MGLKLHILSSYRVDSIFYFPLNMLFLFLFIYLFLPFFFFFLVFFWVKQFSNGGSRIGV